jgi:uncharacterized OsmC-like protein
MGEVTYVSRVRIERLRGPLRHAYLPAEAEPVAFGVHDAIAEHYGVPPGGETERATTLDYVVAAAAGWLTGTFGGALEARQVAANEGRLSSEATGEVEVEDGVLVIKRIHVRYLLQVDADTDREKVERAFQHHMPRCPVYRSIRSAIECTTELELISAQS